nr:unnamed protein product [Callosobruchus chinensis]
MVPKVAFLRKPPYACIEGLGIYHSEYFQPVLIWFARYKLSEATLSSKCFQFFIYCDPFKWRISCFEVKIQQQEQSLPRVEFHSSQAFFLLDLDVVLDQLFAHPGAQINDVMVAHWNNFYMLNPQFDQKIQMLLQGSHAKQLSRCGRNVLLNGQPQVWVFERIE